MQEHTCHLRSFFGDSLTTLECDRIALDAVAPNLLKLEDDLMETKWWDYRPLHPTEATYHFIHVYSEIYREAYARDVDFREAKNVRGFIQDDQLAISAAEAWWKARQAADGVGARYSVFIRSIFTFARDKGWKHYPRPEHLYSEGLLDVAVEAWSAEQEACIQYPKSALYSAGSQFWAKPAFNKALVNTVVGRNIDTLPKLVSRGVMTHDELRAAMISEHLPLALELGIVSLS